MCFACVLRVFCVFVRAERERGGARAWGLVGGGGGGRKGGVNNAFACSSWYSYFVLYVVPGIFFKDKY